MQIDECQCSLPLIRGGALIANVISNGKINQIEVPYYPLTLVGLFECAKYVRLAAKQIFGKHFARCNAWDRRYEDAVVAEINGTALGDLQRQRILQQGMVVGFYNPESHYKNHRDIKGKPIRYSHNALFVGLSSRGRLLFAHQYGAETRLQDVNSILRQGLEPIEILDARS